MFAQAPTRRTWLRASAALGAALVAPRFLTAQTPVRLVGPAFTLGVASGYPRPDGFTLWTRLAPIPLSLDGGMPAARVRVDVEVALDEAFAQVVARATRLATPEWAHSVHVDVRGLEAGRVYFYRFIALGEASPVGRTRTAPAVGAQVDRLRFATGSCQHFEDGFFVGHRHLATEDVDLMVFLGDYIYERSAAREAAVRAYWGGEVYTLEGYRARYAQHRTDADLQRLHAVAPWILVWDDHEVDNDWADWRSELLEPGFRARRAAAFQAYWEHQPMPEHMRPSVSGEARIYDTLDYGALARFYLLDDRQYRTPQACPDPERGGGSRAVVPAACPGYDAPDRTLLGEAQSRWLDAALKASGARWNVLSQQTLMAPGRRPSPQGQTLWTDGWDGYPVARQVLLDSVRKHRVQNPLVVGGDIHATVVANIHANPLDPRSPVVASEVCGTSLTSPGWSAEDEAGVLRENPHVKLVNARQRGYVVFDVTPQGVDARLRVVDEKKRDSGVATAAQVRLQAGRPGVEVAG